MTSHVQLPIRKPRFRPGDWVQFCNSELGSIEKVHASGDGFCYDVCVGRCIGDSVPDAHLTLLTRDEGLYREDNRLIVSERASGGLFG